MKYKFNDDTYIMIDRTDSNFSGVEYQIKKDGYFKNSEYHKNGVWVRITKKGFKTLEENLNNRSYHHGTTKYILEFVSDELNRYLYFDSREENHPEIYKQIIESIK